MGRSSRQSGSGYKLEGYQSEVAKSGNLGFVSGTYEFTMNDAGDKATTDKGKYVEVWKKQADGKWKCGTDIWNSDLAASPAPLAETK